MFTVRSSKGASFCPNTKSYLAHIASSFVFILNFPANIVISLFERKASSAAFTLKSPE
jgi:hypothetical protein